VNQSLRELALLGRALEGETVIDCHGHLGPWFAFHVPMGSARGMIVTMDRLGIGRVIVSAHAAIGPDYALGNELADQATVYYPGRLFAYVGVNPNYPSEEMRAELEKHLSKPGFVGIKMHPDVHRYRANGEGYRVAWEAAHERGLPILSHTWHGSSFSAPGMFRDLARDYSGAKIILGHSGGSTEGHAESAKVAGECANVYLDICGSQHFYGSLERVVANVGAERILFGTDLPFLDPRGQLGRVLFSTISDDDKRLILGLNSLRVFGFE